MLTASKGVEEYPYRAGVATDWVRLGDTVRQARERKGISQERMAQLVSWSHKQYQLLEQGKIGEGAHKPRGPSPIQLGAISNVLAMPISEIYEAAGWVHSNTRQLWEGLPPDEQALIVDLVKKLSAAVKKEKAAV